MWIIRKNQGDTGGGLQEIRRINIEGFMTYTVEGLKDLRRIQLKDFKNSEANW